MNGGHLYTGCNKDFTALVLDSSTKNLAYNLTFAVLRKYMANKVKPS